MSTSPTPIDPTASPKDGQPDASHAQRHQAEPTPRHAEPSRQREGQPRPSNEEDDPASDANTESANHPNDE